MGAAFDQAEAALDQTGAAACVDHPPGAEGGHAVFSGDCDLVHASGIELEVLHTAAVAHRDAIFGVHLQEVVFEAAAIELKRGNRREPQGADFDAPGDVAVVAVGKEVAEAEFFEVPAAEMRGEIQARVKVMRANLDARFAHLECRLGNRMAAFLGYEDSQRWRLHPQLARKTPAGEAAAQDDDVEGVGIRHGRFRLGQGRGYQMRHTSAGAGGRRGILWCT